MGNQHQLWLVKGCQLEKLERGKNCYSKDPNILVPKGLTKFLKSSAKLTPFKQRKNTCMLRRIQYTLNVRSQGKQLVTNKSTFLILSASFSSTSCCFSSGNFWDNFKNRCFLAWGFVFVLFCSFTKKKTGRTWWCFSRLLSHLLLGYFLVSGAAMRSEQLSLLNFLLEFWMPPTFVSLVGGILITQSGWVV